MKASLSLIRLMPAWLLVVSGCGGDVVGPEEADPRLRTDVTPAADWVLVQRPGFSFVLPPGFEKLPLQPIDSDAATYALGESSLHHDYGFYTGPWSHDGPINGTPIRDVVRQYVQIGGKTAELVAFRYGAIQVVRAWWRQVDTAHGQDEHLLVRIETPDTRVRAELLASMYSVDFP
ncbi:MAG: hypothetical protein P8170_10150 [Gemmatimonadota bacterium]|jgi:hypothetical protein